MDRRDRRVPPDIQGRTRKGGGGSGPRRSSGGPAGPSGYLEDSAAPSIGTAPASRTIPPPQWVRPPQATDFVIQADGGGFNNMNTPQVIAGSQAQIPGNQVGVIRSLVLSVNNLTTTSDLRWRLRFDGVPVQGWSNISIFPGLIASFNLAFGPEETFIPVPDGSLIDVQVIVDPADGNTYQAGVSYHGWHYSKTLADVFTAIYTP